MRGYCVKQELLPEPDFYKHNDYIKILQVKNQMNIHQQKIFDAVLSTVQQMKKLGQIESIIREGDLELDYDIFKSHIMKGSRISKINRSVLKQAMEDMVSIRFSWSTDEEVGAVVLFQKGVIDFTTKKVKITFGKDFRTENLVPSSHYTALSYDYLNKFRSQYSRSLYQYFKMLIGKNVNKPFKTNCSFETDYLKSLLGVNKESHKEYYNNNSSFIKRCIKPAEIEINKYSDLECGYELEKYGNRIKFFHFWFKPKKDIIIEDDIIVEKEKPKEKSLFTVGNFKKFKDQIVTKYSGSDITNQLEDFPREDVLKMSSSGYLQINDNVLSKSDSLKIWNYLFENQEIVGVVKEITDLDLAKRFIGKHITSTSIEDGKEIEKVMKIINLIEEKMNLFRLHLQNVSDMDIPPIKSKELFHLEQLENMNFMDTN